MVFIFRMAFAKPPRVTLDPIYSTLLEIYGTAIFSTATSPTKEEVLKNLNSNAISGYLTQLENEVGGAAALKAKLLEIARDPSLADKYAKLKGLSDLIPNDRSVALVADSIKVIAGFYYVMSLTTKELQTAVPNISQYASAVNVSLLDPVKVPDLNRKLSETLNSEYGEDGAVLGVALRLYNGDFEATGQKSIEKKKKSEEEIQKDTKKANYFSKDLGNIFLGTQKDMPTPLTIPKGPVSFSFPSKLNISYGGYNTPVLQDAITYIITSEGGTMNQNANIQSLPSELSPNFLAHLAIFSTRIEG